MQRGNRHSSDPSWIAGSSAMHTNEKNPEQSSILRCAMISRVKKIKALSNISQFQSCPLRI